MCRLVHTALLDLVFMRCVVRMHARTHTRTHTHARTHAFTHARTPLITRLMAQCWWNRRVCVGTKVGGAFCRHVQTAIQQSQQSGSNARLADSPVTSSPRCATCCCRAPTRRTHVCECDAKATDASQLCLGLRGLEDGRELLRQHDVSPNLQLATHERVHRVQLHKPCARAEKKCGR
jgi:hypothetical protein